MILNNVKIGKENISKLIEMGTGDIKISVARSQADQYAAICLKQDVEGEIGRKDGNTCGLTTDHDTPDTMIVFKKVESIDVLMEKLKKAKIILRNLLKNQNQ